MFSEDGSMASSHASVETWVWLGSSSVVFKNVSWTAPEFPGMRRSRSASVVDGGVQAVAFRPQNTSVAISGAHLADARWWSSSTLSSNSTHIGNVPRPLDNKPLQRPVAYPGRSTVGWRRDGAGCARTSSRPCYARGVRLAPAAERQIVGQTNAPARGTQCKV